MNESSYAVEEKNKAMKYCVVSAKDESTLEEIVEAKLEQGWILQGGVSVAFYDGYKTRWAQAMVRQHS